MKAVSGLLPSSISTCLLQIQGIFILAEFKQPKDSPVLGREYISLTVWELNWICSRSVVSHLSSLLTPLHLPMGCLTCELPLYLTFLSNVFSPHIDDGICLYLSLKGVGSVSLIECFTIHVFSRSISSRVKRQPYSSTKHLISSCSCSVQPTIQVRSSFKNNKSIFSDDNYGISLCPVDSPSIVLIPFKSMPSVLTLMDFPATFGTSIGCATFAAVTDTMIVLALMVAGLLARFFKPMLILLEC